MGIAPAATAALSQDEILAGGHIHNDLTGGRIPHNRAARHLDDERLAALTAHFPALAVLTCLGSVLALIPEVQQRGQIIVDPQDDAAAMAAVTAVGTAGGNIFFPVECHRAVTALATNDGNSNFIYKHFHIKDPPLSRG